MLKIINDPTRIMQEAWWGHFLFLTSNFLLLTSNFDVRMLARMCPSMHAYMRVDTNVCLSVCLYACKIVYKCVCQNEGLIGILCACCETCQTILASESWKSVNVQKVPQTDQMVLGGS